MQHLPEPLAPLRAFNQFVLWKAVPSRRRPGKVDKFPCSLDGNVVDAHDPQYWLDADTAVAMSEALGLGVGFVFTADDPFFFVDIDSAYADGKWSDIATRLCSTLAGAAVEVSQSGTGLHIIGQYTGPAPDHACKNLPKGLECYTDGRFVALTGLNATGSASAVMTDQLRAVVGEFFPVSLEGPRAADWTTVPHPDSRPIGDDDALIAKALAATGQDASAVFGGVSSARATFKDLWECNVEALAAAYPDEARTYDASSADAALAQHLAFWTGGQCDRIERLMRRSALVRRKWDYHKSYMSRTIRGAVGRQTAWYSVGADTVTVDPVESVLAEPVLRGGYQLLSPSEQMAHFAGCVYIAEINRVFTPNGAKLKAEQFNAMYGGYNFAVDDTGEKNTKTAWEAFTQSQCCHFPKADGFCFRPQLEPGTIVIEEGRRYVNTYVPIDVHMVPGDVTPFLTHLTKVLPIESDRQILLAYMAACIQHKGYKIQWAPLLQGCEGNGKTLFTRCVAYALGKRYTHFPKASKIDSEFNGWLLDKLFIGVEDIYVPENRREILETIKPMITGGDGLEIQFKGVDQITRDVCCNFMLNSNHKDAVRKTLNDRRYAVFYTAQQEACDLARDGMVGDYFPRLYEWLNNGGYAAVAHYLHTYAIPEALNPTTVCQRAPETSSTTEAVTVSMGSVEQEIMEAIDEGRQGFAGGWVSSFALDRLIEGLRKSSQIPRNKRRDLMRSIGYDYHPALRDGRVDNPLPLDGGKPRLYVKAGHLALNVTNRSEIARMYSAAQGDPLSAAQLGLDNTVSKD